MKALQNLFGAALALVFIAAVAAGIWYGIEFAGVWFAALTLPAQCIAAAIALVLVSAAWISSAIRRVGRDRLAVPLREEKAATYRLFVDCWQRRLHMHGESSELDDAMTSLGRLLALCGSAAVVEKHAQLQAGSGDAWTLFTEALQQIRRELDAEPLAGAALQAVLASHAVQSGEMENRLAAASVA